MKHYLIKALEKKHKFLNTCTEISDDSYDSSDSDELILKRTKPLPNSRSTLMETMGLQMERRKKHKKNEKKATTS